MSGVLLSFLGQSGFSYGYYCCIQAAPMSLLSTRTKNVFYLDLTDEPLEVSRNIVPILQEQGFHCTELK